MAITSNMNARFRGIGYLLCPLMFFLGALLFGSDSSADSAIQVMSDRPYFKYYVKENLLTWTNSSSNPAREVKVFSGRIGVPHSFVSPDGRKIAFIVADEIEGKKRAKLLVFDGASVWSTGRFQEDEFESQPVGALFGEVRWLPDSEGFLVKQFREDHLASILRYELPTMKFDTVLPSLDRHGDFAIDTAAETILYQDYTENGDLVLRTHSIGETDQSGDPKVDEGSVVFKDWFYCFSPLHGGLIFGDSIHVRNYSDTVVVAYKEKGLELRSQILGNTIVYPEKTNGRSLYFNLDYAYFLPANRHFVASVIDGKARQQILYDCMTNTYLPTEEIVFLFSVPLSEVNNVKVGSYVLFLPNWKSW